MNALAACRAYLAKLPPAVSGAGGHPATFRAACECVRFGLSDADALALLREWNATHCQPPWTEKELMHKLNDARRVAAGRVRAVIQRPPAVRVVWKVERKATPAEPVKPQPLPPAAPSDTLSGVWIVRPGEPIPAQFVDVLRTWAAIRQHPAWKGHPQLA
jgi:hypothetical protein